MKALPVKFRLGLLFASFIGTVAQPAAAQNPSPKEAQPPALELRELTGGDATRVEELEKAVKAALSADRWDLAIASEEKLLALRALAQGPKHFKTVNEEWRLKTLRRVGPMAKEERAAFQSADELNAQGSTLHGQGKYKAAQLVFEKVLEIYRRQLTEDNPLSAAGLHDVATCLMAQGKYAAAIPLNEKALEIRRRLLTELHPDTADSYGNLAGNLDYLARYSAAQSLYEKALEIYRRLFTDNHPYTAGSYNNLALNLRGQGKYSEAQPLLEKALEIRRRLLGDDDPHTAASYNNVGANLNAQGRYAEAEPLFEKALLINRRLLGDDHPETARSYHNLAFTHHAQGKYAAAQPLYEKALEIDRRLLGDDHPDTAGAYNSVAFNLNAQGKYAAAQPLYEKALAIYRRLLGDDHPDTARVYNNLAFNLNAQGKYVPAQPIFEKALAIRRQRLTDLHPLTALSYDNLARNFQAQGNYALAQPLLEKALAIRQRLLTEEHPDTATSYNNLGLNLDAQGNYAAAQALFEKALEINRRLHSTNLREIAISEANLGSNLYSQGKYAEARDLFRAAVKSVDLARVRIAFSGLERAGAIGSARPRLAAVLARLGQPAEAWQALEEGLGRGLLDELAARRDWRLTPEERARLRELTTQLERLDRLMETTPKGLDQAVRAQRFAELEHQRELASIAFGEFQAKLVKDKGALAGEVSTLTEIQAALPADAALVAWVDINPFEPNAADPDGDHWGVVVRNQGAPAWVRITGTGPDGRWTKEDWTLGDRVRMELRKRPGAGSSELRPLLEKLRVQRLEPLARALGTPSRRLIVLPSRVMAGIPVEALLASDDIRTVSYAPSATVLKYLREQPRPDRHAGLLALGDPVYDSPDKKIRSAARGGDEDFAPLPGTRYEVERLAQFFKSDERLTRVLLEADASEPELVRLAASSELGRFGFIHLATHGVIDEDVPARSALILTQTGLPDPLQQALGHQPVFDGRLSVREIQRGWDLKADLVTLSACETALGRSAGGEGFVGFTQALLMSGTRSVCLSLWKVDDTATALLMQRFYANMLGRRPGQSAVLPKAEALREAKAWLRGLHRAEVLTLTAELTRGAERGKGGKGREPATVPGAGDNDRPYESPHYWAAFVLSGDPD